MTNDDAQTILLLEEFQLFVPLDTKEFCRIINFSCVLFSLNRFLLVLCASGRNISVI